MKKGTGDKPQFFKNLIDKINAHNLKKDAERIRKLKEEELEKSKEQGEKYNSRKLEELTKLEEQVKDVKESKVKAVLKAIKKILKTILLIIILIGVGAAGFLFIKVKPIINSAKSDAFDKLNTIDINTFTGKHDTVIYDNNKDILASINISNYQYAKSENISKWITEGYIAVEDNEFKYHKGIDYRGIARAGLALVKNKGKITQGGSTITQQVVKNNLLSDEKDKFKRKIIEIFLAPELEKEYSKAQIMEFYANTNYYANQMYGVETASQFYFDKHAKDLDIAEAAVLVGLSNSPERYNPVTNKEASLEKRNWVIDRMAATGKITEETAENEKKKPLNLVLERKSREKESYQVSYAIHGAALELMKLDKFEFKYVFNTKEEEKDYILKYKEEYSKCADKIRSGGYEIYTALDSKKQEELQNILDKKLSRYREKAVDGRYTMQGSIVLMNNKTHLVEAIIGGRGTDDEFNRGFLATRQPGSAIKPFVVYAPAIETGKWFPSSRVVDKAIPNGPSNAYRGYKGATTMRLALKDSVNTVAWQLMETIGPNVGLDYLGKLQFSKLSYLDKGNLSLALGGFTNGVSPEEMVKAMSTIANHGEYVDNTTIKQIDYQNEGTIYTSPMKGKQVYDADTAYMVADMLRAVVKNGTGTRGNIEGLDIIAKTGTTNGKKDAWFLGATPTYTIAVWMGYDTPRNTNQYGGDLPAEIFREAMLKVSKGIPAESFEQPDSIVVANYDNNGNMTGKNTGRKDLFSQTLIDRATEMERKMKELQKQEEDNKIYERVGDLLKELKAQKLETIEDLTEYRNKTAIIERELLKIYATGIKSKATSEYEEVKKDLESKVAQLELLEEQEKALAEQKAQAEKQKEIEAAITKFGNYVPTSTKSIAEVDRMIENTVELINDLDNVELQSRYRKEIQSHLQRIQVELAPFRQQLLIEQENAKASLREKLENSLERLNQYETEDVQVRNLYSQINSLLKEAKQLGIESEFKPRYLDIQTRITRRTQDLEDQRKREEIEKLEEERLEKEKQEQLEKEKEQAEEEAKNQARKQAEKEKEEKERAERQKELDKLIEQQEKEKQP